MRRSKLLLTLFLLSLYSGISLYANSQSSNKPSGPLIRLNLTDALQIISKEHNVRFIYERTLLAPMKVTIEEDLLRHSSLEKIMGQLLAPHALIYRPVNKNYFMILKRNTTQQDPSGAYITDTIRPTVVSPAKGSNNRENASLTGMIIDGSTDKPIEGAIVQLTKYGLYAVSDGKGVYSFREVPAGRTHVQVQSISMLGMDQDIDLQPGANRIDFKMVTNALGLKEVVVIAKEGKAGQATSTLISRTAIEHMQATNLGEVLQLLPGAVASNPDFTNTNRSSIRQYEADNTGSLGTAVVINGAPLSNNANLQATNTATAGVLSSFSTSSGMGIDMRQLSADNVESIEVIRGIPSVEYGDLTAGAILVKTKAGKEPTQLKARINPKLTQFWLGKGFGLGKDKGALFADVDFTKANDKQITAYEAYERVTGSLQYTNTFGRSKPLYTNTHFSFGMNLDESKIDPDYEIDQIVRKAQNYSYQLSTNGRWNLGKRFARSVNYTLSAAYSHQKGFQQQRYTADISPVSTAKENTTMEVDYLASSWLSQLWIDGQPLNLFAKLNDNFYFKSGRFNHSFLIGGDWKMDANLGKGKTFDESQPPRTSDNAGIRERAFKDIPALNQFGLYAEDKIFARLADREFVLQLGLRYDNIQPFTGNSRSVLAPRINASYELVNNFYLRAGYGITAKSPTLLYLYPDNAYFDMISFNYYKDDPAERLALMTTRVFNTENPDLKVVQTRKNELGIDWAFAHKKRLSVTAYYEETRNGYEMTTNLNSIQFTNVPKYTLESAPPGEKPVLSPVITDSLWVVTYNSPANSRHIINKGIEFDLDLGRFDGIRTSFVINGAYLSTRSTSSDPYILLQRVANKPLTRLGVYGTDRGKQSERFATTIRAIHNIPELKFVITLSAQTIWIDKDRYVNYMSIPTGYVPVTAAGQKAEIVPFSKAEQEAITPDTDRDIYLSLNEGYFKTESWKPLWLFNMKLTKEFAKNMVFSFFANNVFNYRPLQASKRYPTDYTKRNISLFFGSEVSIKF